MKKIKLSNGMKALVDDEDYEYLSQFRWYPLNTRMTTYAKRKIYINGGQITILMHREIMKTPQELEVDHRDHNGLNNQRGNLRNCTHGQNDINKISNNPNGYRGVEWVLKRKKWKIRARIKRGGVSKHLGYFKTLEDAARAYDKASLEYDAEFAVLNFP